MEGFVVGGRESTLLKTVSFLLSVSVVSRNSGKCRTQVHFSVSDTGWIFFFPPSQEQQKQHSTSHLKSQGAILMNRS